MKDECPEWGKTLITRSPPTKLCVALRAGREDAKGWQKASLWFLSRNDSVPLIFRRWMPPSRRHQAPIWHS
jgi:hypothetical protein